MNIGVDFTIVPRPEVNSSEALLECFLLLKDIFDVSNSNFGDILVLSEISSQLQSLERVRAVSDFKLTNITGTVDGRSYSDISFDVKANTRNGIVYMPNDMIWECKFKDFDITGRTV